MINFLQDKIEWLEHSMMNALLNLKKLKVNNITYSTVELDVLL